MAYDLIGALPAGATPVWVRAVVSREGNDVVTRCCVVAEGQVMPIEVRVNVPAVAAALRSMGLVPRVSGDDTVSGFGSFLKKAVKKITKNKVVKAVGKAVSKVAKSPIVQIANPMLAISAHTTSKALGGKGVIKGPAGKLVDFGTKLAMTAAGPAAKMPSALSFVGPKASAALGVGMKAVQTAKLGSSIASVAKVAQKNVSLGKVAAKAVKKASPAVAKKLAPVVKKAAKTQAAVKKLAPKLAKQVVKSSNVKKSLATIAAKAKAGSKEAKQAAAVIAKSAEALDKIARLQAQAAGGVPGLLVTADGRIVRAPRGRFQLRTSTTARPDILYRGAKEPTLKGLFAAVSGASVGNTGGWGGVDDPANDIQGPRPGVIHPGGGWKLDSYGVSGSPRPVIDTTGVASAFTP